MGTVGDIRMLYNYNHAISPLTSPPWCRVTGWVLGPHIYSKHSFWDYFVHYPLLLWWEMRDLG